MRFQARNLYKLLKMNFLNFLSLCFVLQFFSCSSEVELKDKAYRVGVSASFYGENLGEREQNVIAFVNDLLDRAFWENPEKVTRVPIDSTTPLALLNTKDLDAILIIIDPQKYLSHSYMFSSSLLPLGPNLLVRKESGFDSLLQMNGRVVGVREGASIAFNVKSHPNLIMRYYTNPRAAMVDLVQEGVDGLILEGLEAYKFANSSMYKGQVQVVRPPLTSKGLFFVSLSGKTDFIEYFNHQLEILKSNGEIERLNQKWKLAF